MPSDASVSELPRGDRRYSIRHDATCLVALSRGPCAPLGPHLLLHLLRTRREECYPSGSVVLAAGQPVEGFWIVEDGMLVRGPEAAVLKGAVA
jgi:hypothetical protein